MTEENIIIAARLPHDGKLKDIEVLRREKVRMEKAQLASRISNLIYSSTLPCLSLSSLLYLSLGVQDECTTILKTISHHINTEHNELQSHRLLSIFKMSEVDVVWPESTSAARSGHGHGQQTVANSLLTLLLIALVHCWRRAASPITT